MVTPLGYPELTVTAEAVRGHVVGHPPRDLHAHAHTHTPFHNSERSSEEEEGRCEQRQKLRQKKKADLSVLGLHSVPAALRQTVLAVGGQRVLLIAVVRLTQTSLSKEREGQAHRTRQHFLTIATRIDSQCHPRSRRLAPRGGCCTVYSPASSAAASPAASEPPPLACSLPRSVSASAAPRPRAPAARRRPDTPGPVAGEGSRRQRATHTTSAGFDGLAWRTR